jgi:DNA primase
MTWIDFKELRAKLRFQDVLTHYNVKLTVNGDRAMGFCPLTAHQGKGTSPSFSAHLGRGIWQCFGCKASGNVLDFAVRMEGGNPDDAQDVRRIALKLRETFTRDVPAQLELKDVANDTPSRSVIVNPPLDFALQGLDPNHPYVRERGFTDVTIQHFGLGFCNRGLLKGRIAIPLHDTLARLIGYAGRLTKDEDLSERNPKYLLPGRRTRKGEVIEFRKSEFLYNGHSIKKPVDDLIVVEGFPSVWWLHQNGYTSVVGLMGSSCSNEQADLIVKSTTIYGRVWAFTDADQAGDECATSIFEHVGQHRFVRWLRHRDGQPTACSQNELMNLFRQ